jgi:uncharacterized protein YvpB
MRFVHFISAFSLLIFAFLLGGCGGGSSQESPQQGPQSGLDGPLLPGAAASNEDYFVGVIGSSLQINSQALRKDASGGRKLEVPWISQMPPGNDWQNTVNCGPATYLMIEAFLRGRDLSNPEEDIKQMINYMAGRYSDYKPKGDLGSNEYYYGDYTSDATMKKLLNDNGFDAMPVTTDGLNGIKAEINSGHPVIVWVTVQGGNDTPEMKGGADHWMLVVGYDDQYIYVNDPGRSSIDKGKKGYSKNSFETVWKSKGKLGYSVRNKGDALPLAISDKSLSMCPNLPVGLSFSQVLTAVNGVPPYVWNVELGKLPDGITLSSDGVMKGTPITEGIYSFTVKVTDNSGQTVTRESSITIGKSNTSNPLTISTASELPSARVNQEYRFKLTSIGGFLTYLWSWISGNFPDGLGLNINGELYGKPIREGRFTFGISVEGSTLSSAGKRLSSSTSKATKEFSILVLSDQVINPTIAQSPMTVTQGGSISQWGTGFSPNSTATLHFRKPDGTEFAPSQQVIKADGSFSINYVVPSDRSSGAYTWWGVDGPTGRVSNSVRYTVGSGASTATPGSISVSPSSGSWTSSQNLNVSSNDSTTIYYTMVNTYDGSTPSDPATPSSSSNNGSLSGPSGTFQLYGKDGSLKKIKLKFVGCNSAGCGPVSSVYSYSIDLRAATPGSISVSPSSGSWTSSQNLNVSSNGSTTIYYKMVNTYDGSTPSTPANPSSSSNDGSLSGPSGTFQLYGRDGNLKKIKLKFVGCNGTGCGPVSGVYSYSIDLR